MRGPDAVGRGLRALTRRSQQVLLLAGLTGVLTGLAVAGFERLTSGVLLDGVLDLPLALQVAVPAVGLFVAVACLRLGGSGTTATTTDEYIRSFHDPARGTAVLPTIARMLASVATLGGGAPLGYEGPSILAGSSIGSWIQRRLPRFFTTQQSRVLLVAGAAAGVSAIFKAPVTGLVFALEVPYQEDLARRMLLPAAISSAASYVTFAALIGTEPILPIAGQPPFDLRDIGGAAAIGLACGVLARAFVFLIHLAKDLSHRGHPAVRTAIGGGLLAATVLVGHAALDEGLVLGPGYHALEWTLDPHRAVWAIVVLGTLRVVGTVATVGGGGTGGLFIPLVIQGALVGRAFGGVFDTSNPTLFPLVGIAAFLGAGYRVPLAAVVFVAEATGRAGYVVPGLIAAVVAQLVVGHDSLSPYQVAGRLGHLERRLGLPLAAFVDAGARTVPPDATVSEFFWQHLVGTRQQSVPVVDGSTYLGMARAEDLRGVPREEWPTTPVSAVMTDEVPVASTSWSVSDAVRAMQGADVDRLAVCDDGRFVGVIGAADLVRLDEILDRTDTAF